MGREEKDLSNLRSLEKITTSKLEAGRAQKRKTVEMVGVL